MNFSPDVLMMLPIWFVALLFSTTCHEAAHALAAKLGGDLTAYHGGHVSLDPIPHIKRSPFGMVVVPILSFLLNGWMIGWASVPLDPFWAGRHPRRAAWVSAAGPGANFVLVVLVGIIIHIGMAAGFLNAAGSLRLDHLVVTSSGEASALTSFLSILFSLNLILGTFNLLPVPPLDGHKIITLFMSERMAVRWGDFLSEPIYSLLGLLVAWKLFGFIFFAIWPIALELLYPG